MSDKLSENLKNAIEIIFDGTELNTRTRIDKIIKLMKERNLTYIEARYEYDIDILFHKNARLTKALDILLKKTKKLSKEQLNVPVTDRLSMAIYDYSEKAKKIIYEALHPKVKG